MIEGLKPLSEKQEDAVRGFGDRMAEAIAKKRRGGLKLSERQRIAQLEERVAELERLRELGL